jgi:hypothetical protein
MSELRAGMEMAMLPVRSHNRAAINRLKGTNVLCLLRLEKELLNEYRHGTVQ